MAKVPIVHREARFSGIRVAVSIEESVLPDTHTSRSSSVRGFMYLNLCYEKLRTVILCMILLDP